MNPPPPPVLEPDLLSDVVSEDEKVQILGQIEQAALSNRLTVDHGAFLPRKRGILFPVAVNLAAVLLIAGAWFGASWYFQTKEQGLLLKTDKLFSAESKLLAKVLEDSKNQLAAKNAEIDKIQKDLDKVAAEKADLQKSFNTRVTAREASLQKEMQDALASERKRLQEAGYDAAEVEKRLKDFVALKNAEFNNQLADYRKQVQAEIDQRTLAVTSLQAKLQSSAAEQEQLRKTIESQTKAREKDLQTQLSSQAADLEQVKKDRDDLTAFFRMTDPATAEVRAAFESGDQARTQTALLSLRQVLAKAQSSPSETVRSRAAVQASLAATLDGAVTALGTGTADLKKAQAKRDQELASLQQAESQKTLAAAEAKVRLAQTETETLRKAAADAVSQLENTRGDLEASRAEAARLAAQVAELTAYRKQVETLSALFDSSYPNARERFQTTFSSDAGLKLFPNFPPAWQELENLLQAGGTAATIRKQAFEDVLTFTDYLQGNSSAGASAKDSAEKLARSDETYRRVVEGIQSLAASGAKESAVSTLKTALYGMVVSTGAGKVVLEPLTKVRPQEGQTVELRRMQGKRETVLGQGLVLTAADRRVEISWADDHSVPLSGDPAYLVLP